MGLKQLFDIINGESAGNESMAEFLLEQVQDLPFMNQ